MDTFFDGEASVCRRSGDTVAARSRAPSAPRHRRARRRLCPLLQSKSVGRTVAGISRRHPIILFIRLCSILSTESIVGLVDFCYH